MIRIAFVLVAVAAAIVQFVEERPAHAEAARGAAGAAAGRELTLEQALSMAKKANRGLAAERARLAQAQATVDRAWTVLFPTIVAQGKYTRNSDQIAPMFGPGMPALVFQPYNQLDAAVQGTMPLLVPAAYPALKAVNMNAKVIDENVRAAENNVLFTVARMFYSAAIADEVVGVRKSNIEVARATLENAKTRFASGAVTKVDVERAEVAFLRAEQFGREAALGREQAYRALGTLIQLEGTFQVRATPPAETAAAAKTPNDLGMTLRLRPEFRSLEATVAAEEAEVRSHGWRWAPSLSGFGNARVFNYDNFIGKSYAWAAGVQLDWVIYDQGVRDTQRRMAAAIAAEVSARAEVMRDSIRDDLANGRRQLETRTQAQQTFERAVQLARNTLELVRIQYEAGQGTQVDLLQAQDSLVAAQEALAQAHLDVAVADLTLRRAAGTFP
jgi:outer membrane protein